MAEPIYCMPRGQESHGAAGATVKAAAFVYYAPESVEDAVSLLATHGDEAKVLAGGQSLMPLMALRLAAPEVLVDINRLPLDTIENGSGRLRLGALARHRAIEQLDELASVCPMIVDAVRRIGHVAIRNRGTVVGSLAHGDPAAEWPALALALDAEVIAVGPRGTRRIPAGAFFESYLTTALADDELATHVEIELQRGRVGSSFVGLARRHGDFALCGVGALLRLGAAGTIEDARIAVAGAGSTPLRIGDAERLLVGERPSPGAWEAAAQAVFETVDPPGDIHGSSAYRRTVIRVVARRALEQALARVGGDGGAE
jgi:aerobic carbon-monoxide dehydrogenase medium subunit